MSASTRPSIRHENPCPDTENFSANCLPLTCLPTDPTNGESGWRPPLSAFSLKTDKNKGSGRCTSELPREQKKAFSHKNSPGLSLGGHAVPSTVVGWTEVEGGCVQSWYFRDRPLPYPQSGEREMCRN